MSRNQVLKILSAWVLVFICVLSVWVGRTVFFPKAKFTKDALDLVRSKGNPNAPVWIVEYFDYQCPSCQRAAFLLRDISATYPSRVYLQARFFPARSAQIWFKGRHLRVCGCDAGEVLAVSWNSSWETIRVEQRAGGRDRCAFWKLRPIRRNQRKETQAFSGRSFDQRKGVWRKLRPIRFHEDTCLEIMSCYDITMKKNNE